MVACPLFPTALHRHQTLKIKLEIDTDPPAGFESESRTVLLPTPFAVRVYRRPDLFAGKMHAILCWKWKSRVKGRGRKRAALSAIRPRWKSGRRISSWRSRRRSRRSEADGGVSI
jgi:hypothetical protein